MKLIHCFAIGLTLVSTIACFLVRTSPSSANESANELTHESKICKGADCIDKNPIEYQCDADAIVVDEVTQSFFRFGNPWHFEQVIVRQMYSQTCQATWTRAFIPNDTYLFVRERGEVAGGESIFGMVNATGTGYFWADSNMASSDASTQACVSLSTGVWFWYDRYCTEYNVSQAAAQPIP